MGLVGALLELHHRTVRLPRVGRLAGALARLGGPTAQSLLDVGAGDGLVGLELGQALGAQAIQGVDVQVQGDSALAVVPFDGTHLPFDDGAFEIVAIADVLHHAKRPADLLREGLRVARRAVLVKDHFAFGPASRKMLLLLDRIGNARQGVEVVGHYLSPTEWIELVAEAGGEIQALEWPLDIHALPIRTITRSELQFAARIGRRAANGAK